MGLGLLCLVLGFAALLIDRAGALLVAVLTGIAIHHAGGGAGPAICAGIVAYVAADHLLGALMDRGGIAAFLARVYAVSAAGAGLGMTAFVAVQGQGVAVSVTLFICALGALAGALMADRRWRMLA